MSVLAHIVERSSWPPEPVATQALAHILNSHEDFARAFVDDLMSKGRFNPKRIKAEVKNMAGGKPDMTFYDDKLKERAFVENKFWFGFTEYQPVKYLHALPEGGILLFIVPELRVNTAWNELKQRCIKEKHNPEQNGDDDSALVLGKTMKIKSWTDVLNVLQEAAQKGNHSNSDILQLKDLTSRQDMEAFLPVRPDELTNQEVSRRLVNYCDLIKPITKELIRKPKIQRPRASHGKYTSGSYLHIFLTDNLNDNNHQYRVWIGVCLDKWSTYGITPLWVELNLKNDFANFNGNLGQIQERFDGVESVENCLYIPIRIIPSVEQKDVIDSAVDQIVEVVNFLHNLNNPG